MVSNVTNQAHANIGYKLNKEGVRLTHFTKTQNDTQDDGAGGLFVKCVGLTPMLSYFEYAAVEGPVRPYQ